MKFLLFCCCCFFFSFVVFLIQIHQNTQHNGMKLLPTKKRKKSLFSFRCLPDHAVTGLVLVDVRTFQQQYFFAEELFVSLISVKFAIRLSLLQPSFRVLFYSFSGAFLLFEFRRVGEDPGNEVVFTAESNIKPSCNRVTNLVKYYPILQKTAIGQ